MNRSVVAIWYYNRTSNYHGIGQNSDHGKDELVASGGDTYCSNVPQTFLNKESCQLSSNACRPSSNTEVNIFLENSTIAVLNHLTGHYVYAVKGLLVKYGGIVLDHPCTPGLRSRWEPKNLTDCDPTELYSETNSSLHILLSSSGDRNPYVRYVYFPEEGMMCNETDTEPEVEIEVNGQTPSDQEPKCDQLISTSNLGVRSSSSLLSL